MASSSPSGSCKSMGDGWARGNYAASASEDYLIDARSRRSYGELMGSGADQLAHQNPRRRDGGQCLPAPRRHQGWEQQHVSVGRDSRDRAITLVPRRHPGDGQYVRGSSLWGYGYVGDDAGPNCTNINADDTCSDQRYLDGEVEGGPKVAALGMACTQATWPTDGRRPRSMHPGGVTMGFCDGHVQFISDFIQTTTGVLFVDDVLRLGQADSFQRRPADRREQLWAEREA